MIIIISNQIQQSLSYTGILLFIVQMGNCQAANDIMVPNNFQGIIIKCRLWKKTYSNLFDYAAQPNQVFQQDLVANLTNNQQCALTKAEQQFKIMKQVKNSTQPILIKISHKSDQYFLEPNLNAQRLSSNQIWIAIKSIPSGRYKLKQGDILRIGNQKVKVKQIILEDNQVQSNLQIQAKHKIYQSMTKQNSQGFNPDQKAQQPICRVCLQQAQIGNPLLAPCKCSGSAKFIHIKCIQEWFNKIIDPRKINSSIVITWKPLICQLCSQPLPFKIYLDEVKHFTVNIPRPEKPYIVLNPIIKEKSSTRIYHLVSFKQKTVLTVGRKKDADVVLDEDSSISRHHSVIEYMPKKQNQKERIMISDKDSKFGTLVLMKKPIHLAGNLSGITLQFGGNIATFLMKQTGDKTGEENEINQSQKSTSTQSMHQQQNQQKKEQQKK